MAEFVPRWSDWSNQSDGHREGGRTACSSTTETPRPFREGSIEPASRPDAEADPPTLQTCKTFRTGSVGFVGPKGEASSMRTMVERLDAMDLQTFARTGLVVRLWSDALGRELAFASDNVETLCLPSDESTVFGVADLRKLALLRDSPPAPPTIRDIKSIFRAEVSEIRDAVEHFRREETSRDD